MKKEATSLEKKLKSYSLMTGSILAMTQVSDAQIIHHNISDTTFTDNQTGLTFDLNNDGITDYTFFLIKSGSGSAMLNLIGGFGSNTNYEIAGTVGSSSYVYPAVLQSGDKINNDLEWHSYGSLFWVFAEHYSYSSGSPLQLGNWFGQTEKFVGLRLELNDHKYYGWLRMDVDSFANQFTIRDYAYQAKPDSAILAGDTDLISSVPHVIIDNKISIFSYGKQLIVKTSGNGKENLDIRIYNLFGVTVRELVTKEKEVHLALNELPEGMYLVKAAQAGNEKTRKISIR